MSFIELFIAINYDFGRKQLICKILVYFSGWSNKVEGGQSHMHL